MPNDSLPGPETLKAMQAIGGFMYRAMVCDRKVDFVASSRQGHDGSMELTVLHPDGTLIFNIPKSEREGVSLGA